jgi:hypothetical protein
MEKNTKQIESATITKLENIFKCKAETDVDISGFKNSFTAILSANPLLYTFTEVIVIESPSYPQETMITLLENAEAANEFFSYQFKLLIAVVYCFDEELLPETEKKWQQEIKNSPVDIEIRFFHIDEVIK